MGFMDSLNSLKNSVQDRLANNTDRDPYARQNYFGNNDSYDDNYDDYDEPNYGGGYNEQDSYSGSSRQFDDDRPASLLGNPSRSAVDSVNVFTRSGHRVASDSYEATASSDSYRADSYSQADGAYRAADASWRADTDKPREFVPASAEVADEESSASSYVPPMAQPGVFGATGNTPADRGLTATPRTMSGKLPAYVLKPTSYDDVQTVVRRVRTNQPVILNFRTLNIDTAKRILDFSFGLACGIDGSVEELGDRIFVVLPQGVQLTETDRRKLRQDGLIR